MTDFWKVQFSQNIEVQDNKNMLCISTKVDSWVTHHIVYDNE